MSLQNLRVLVQEVLFINSYLHHYLFRTMGLSPNSTNQRFFSSYRNCELLEGMERVLNTLTVNQVERIERFINYVHINRNNRNLSHMITAYHN